MSIQKLFILCCDVQVSVDCVDTLAIDHDEDNNKIKIRTIGRQNGWGRFAYDGKMKDCCPSCAGKGWPKK